MGDKAAQLEFCMIEWLLAESNAYAELLSERNRYIAELENRVQELLQTNERLLSQERVIYNLEGEPRVFARNGDGTFVEVIDLTNERNVRRRLTYEDQDWFDEMMQA